jgi:integrase/recombinase XerC
MELFHETVAEYMWARDVAGLTPATLQTAVRPVLEACGHYGCVPWRLTSRRMDQYFAGPGKRGHATMRKKIADVDRYFAFLEQRYGGEIARRFGVSVGVFRGGGRSCRGPGSIRSRPGTM